MPRLCGQFAGLTYHDRYAVPSAVPTPSEPRCISHGLVRQVPSALQTDDAVQQDLLICRWPGNAPSRLGYNFQRGLRRRGIPYGVIKALEVFVQASPACSFNENRMTFPGTGSTLLA